MVESSLEYIEADQVITICLYLLNKMWLNFFKVRSYVIFGLFSYFLVDEGLAFLLVDLKLEKSFIT